MMAGRPPALPWVVGGPAPRPPALRPEHLITKDWSGDQPLVSVLCATYQHAGFIRDALDGFLGQETSFPIEVVVRDDASTDGTAEIIRSYAEQYPNILRPILETTNGWPEVQPFDLLRPLARGRFIALCEGDDYWLDPTKLSQQVAHLEQNPRAVVSHHQSLIIDSGVVAQLDRLRPEEQVAHSAAELRRGGRLLTNTILFRNVQLPVNPYRGRYPAGIKFLRVAFGMVGDSVYTAAVVPSVYRRHAGGISSGADEQQSALNVLSSHLWLAHFLTTHGDREAAQVHATQSLQSLTDALQRLQLVPSRPRRHRVRRALGHIPAPARRLLRRLARR